MEQPIIQDDSPEATWFINVGAYPFMDHGTGVRFEPRTPVRTKLTPWMESQPTIQAYEFPAEPVTAEQEAAKAEAEAKALAEAEAKALAEAEALALKAKK